jgi:hypothetical protein
MFNQLEINFSMENRYVLFNVVTQEKNKIASSTQADKYLCYKIQRRCQT